MSSCSQVRDNTQIKTDSKITKFQFAPLKSNVSQPFFHYHHSLALKRNTSANHLPYNCHVRYAVHPWNDRGSCPIAFTPPDGHNTTLGVPKPVSVPVLHYTPLLPQQRPLVQSSSIGGKKFHLGKYKQNIILHL